MNWLLALLFACTCGTAQAAHPDSAAARQPWPLPPLYSKHIRIAAVFVDDAKKNWQFLDDMTEADFNRRRTEMQEEGYTLQDFESYPDGDELKISAVWVKGKGKPAQVTDKLDRDSLLARFGSLRSEESIVGLEVNTHPKRNKLEYMVAYVEGREKYKWMLDVDALELLNKLSAVDAEKEYLESMSAYNTPKGVRFSARIAKNDESYSWKYFFDLEKEALNNKVLELINQDYMLYNIEVYPLADKPVYAALFRKQKNEEKKWLVFYDLSPDEFKQKMIEYRTAGKYLHDFELFGYNNLPDLDAPVVSVLVPEDPTKTIRHTNSAFTLKLSLTDRSGVDTVFVNDKQIPPAQDGTYAYSTRLAEGENTLNLRAVDHRGNVLTKQYMLTYTSDVVPPAVGVLEPRMTEQQKGYTNTQYVTVKFEVTDSKGISAVTLNEALPAAVDGDQYIFNLQLELGDNKLVLAAQDSSGNQTYRTYFLQYLDDAEPPVLTALEPAITRGMTIDHPLETFALKIKAGDKNGVRTVLVNGSPAQALGNGEYLGRLQLLQGLNTVLVEAQDSVGNRSDELFYVTYGDIEGGGSAEIGGKYYALCIGIDKYTGGWNRLENAVNDAKALAELLQSDYQFDTVLTVFDKAATRTEILARLDWLSKRVTPSDNVLIYYSGHGELKREINKGYWVPVESTSGSYISNSEVKDYVNGIRSKHTLLIADACFSGDLFRGQAAPPAEEESYRYFRQVFSKVSKQVMTSGGVEPVMDGGQDGHSVFAYYLLKTLRENEALYIDAESVYNRLKLPVTNNSRQTPLIQRLRDSGDEGGQFVFIHKPQKPAAGSEQPEQK
ncbi:MAG: caspase family protein [Bacteroidetes bacterium]|nr:caspase family protein [Bacteroidota bacterium]